MKKKNLYKNITVYTDLLPEIDEIYKTLRNSEENGDGRYYLNKWTPWSVFGTYSTAKFHPDSQAPETLEEKKYLLDGKNEDFLEIYNKELKAYERIVEAYDIAIDDYIKTNDVKMPENWNKLEPSFCKYTDKMDYDMGPDLTMLYHTDFFEAEQDMPGNKFFITTTMYINDDYEGGDISFYINGTFVDYKPEPGSILIFPSKPPFYHGVKKIKNGQKFLVRKFITYPYKGSQEWLQKQVQFGPMRWAEMEKQRLEAAKNDQAEYVFSDRAIRYPEEYGFSFVQ